MITETKEAKHEALTRIILDIRQGGWAKIFMPANFSILSSSSTACGPVFDSLSGGDAPVGARFFEPLEAIIPQLTRTRECPDLPDADWLALGTLRVLHEVRSGRGFLQEVAATLPQCPDVCQFFATLRSERRLALCREADALLADSLRISLPDALAEVEELRNFDVYAGDGHWHKAAAHDRRPFPDSPKLACGHFYALDMRYNLLRHICVADQIEREHEHDMRALKRQSLEALRQGAGKGRKVLYVWDRAGIDFAAWERWKRRGVYFLSREKDNMALKPMLCQLWDRNDPRNAGVLSDEITLSASGARVRRISFVDAVSGVAYVFVTNEMTLPPGVLAELARRRWAIEKVFDQLKNKMAENKAWATTATAKTMQAIFICITHQLLRALQHLLETDHGIRPKRELRRRRDRIASHEQIATRNHHIFPTLRAAAVSLTQHTVKFLRWLRSCLRREAPWHVLIESLRHSYASI